MFIALQVIDLDTNEVLGYIIPVWQFRKKLTASCVFPKTVARLRKFNKFITDFGTNYLSGKGSTWDCLRASIDIKAHPFIRVNLVEYELKETSNTMLVQVLDMGTK